MLRAESVGVVVRVEVAGTGEEIAAEDLRHGFGRAFHGEHSRTRHVGTAGAGVGLTIARGLIEAHGGQFVLMVVQVPALASASPWSGRERLHPLNAHHLPLTKQFRLVPHQHARAVQPA